MWTARHAHGSASYSPKYSRVLNSGSRPKALQRNSYRPAPLLIVPVLRVIRRRRLPLQIDCSVCEPSFSATLAFTCSTCSGSRGSVVLTFAILIFLLATVVLMIGLNYLVSVGAEESWFFHWWIFSWLTKGRFEELSSASFKILLVVWQIVTQVRQAILFHARRTYLSLSNRR